MDLPQTEEAVLAEMSQDHHTRLVALEVAVSKLLYLHLMTLSKGKLDKVEMQKEFADSAETLGFTMANYPVTLSDLEPTIP